MKKSKAYKCGENIGYIAGAVLVSLIWLIAVFGLVWVLKHILIGIF